MTTSEGSLTDPTQTLQPDDDVASTDDRNGRRTVRAHDDPRHHDSESEEDEEATYPPAPPEGEELASCVWQYLNTLLSEADAFVADAVTVQYKYPGDIRQIHQCFPRGASLPMYSATSDRFSATLPMYLAGVLDDRTPADGAELLVCLLDPNVVQRTRTVIETYDASPLVNWFSLVVEACRPSGGLTIIKVEPDLLDVDCLGGFMVLNNLCGAADAECRNATRDWDGLSRLL